MDDENFEESLSYRRQRNKQAEEELHHISEKLSHRLEELDQVCVAVLCSQSVQRFCFKQIKKCSSARDALLVLQYFVKFVFANLLWQRLHKTFRCITAVDAEASSG